MPGHPPIGAKGIGRTVIPIAEHRPIDLRIKAAEARGFGKAIKVMSDKVMAAKAETFTKQEIQFALMFLKPEE